jgi:WD40 repeat protein
VEWFHHSSYLATASDDKNIILWDIETVRLKSLSPVTLPLVGKGPHEIVRTPKLCVFVGDPSISEYSLVLLGG